MSTTAKLAARRNEGASKKSKTARRLRGRTAEGQAQAQQESQGAQEGLGHTIRSEIVLGLPDYEITGLQIRGRDGGLNAWESRRENHEPSHPFATWESWLREWDPN